MIHLVFVRNDRYLDEMPKSPDDLVITDLVKPYRVQLVHDADDRLVGVNISAAEDGELDHDMIREATRALSDHMRRERMQSLPRVTSITTRVTRGDTPASVRAAVEAHRAGDGLMTPAYLSRLAVAYEELVGGGYNAAHQLAAALGKDGEPMPLPTVRTHIKRARDDGYLSPTTRGREGGEATEKARTTIADLDKH
ncbi:hypothetical protein GCM10010409_34490 [Mycolicibacterium diernhoferi]